MKMIAQQVFTNWHFMRVIRLILSLTILIMAIQTRDWGTGLLGAVFLYTALAGVGCCGPAGCSVPAGKAPIKNADSQDQTEK